MTKLVSLHTHEDLQRQPELRERLEQWDIVNEIDEHIAYLRNNPVPWTTTIEWGKPRQKGVFHPSSISRTCDMYLYLELLGADEEEKLSASQLSIFDTGTVIHEQLQYYQHTRAIVRDYEYQSEVAVAKGSELAARIRMGGSCDGYDRRILRFDRLNIDLRFLWEYKTIKGENFAKLRQKPDIGYVRQVHAYMAATGIPLTVLLYYNKNNSLKKAYLVFFDPSVWSPLQDRFERIVQLADDFELPERSVSNSCFFCKFFKECDPPVTKRSKGAPRLRT